MKKSFICLFSIFTLAIMLWYNIEPSFSQEPSPGPSLYQRLGGVNGIAAVVDDFVDNLLVNEVVVKNEKVVSALGRITKAGLKYHLTSFVCQATGGPEKYTGRTMKDSHAHLDITEIEWNATVGELLKSLAKFNVPKKEQDELAAIVATTKGDIVTAKASPPPPRPAPEATPPALPAPSPEAQVAPPPPPPQPEAQAAPPAEPPSKQAGAETALPIEPIPAIVAPAQAESSPSPQPEPAPSPPGGGGFGN